MASIEFPLSFTRQYSGPLDTTAVFDTLADLNTYIASNPIAYAGQIVSVSADGTLYIIMDDPDSPGTLILNTAVDQDGLDLKADKSTTYTETEVDNLLTGKADKSNTYTETEVDNLLTGKADQSTSYTKTETDTLLDTKPSSADYDNIVQLTQTAYNALGTPASTTLYIIVG
jgi:hypothetical protein